MPILELLEAASTSWDVGKQLWRAVPRGLQRRRFKRFFGRNVFEPDDVYAVVDPYHHPQDRTQPRYIKRSAGRGPDLRVYGADLVLGESTLRFVAYASAAFANLSNSRRPLAVVTDYDAFPRWNATFICYGSPDTNVKSREIEHLPEQRFFRFPFGADGHRCWEVGGRRFGHEANADHGILLRMRNPHSPGHFLFVCAGLSEWGSGGAAYYLFERWEILLKQFGENDFCCVLNVTLHSDQSARVVLSVT